MWVEGGDIHDELLDQLGGVLAPPEDLALTPSAAELEALAAAVAARWPDSAVSPASGAAPAAPVLPLRSGRPPLRRVGSSAWRAGSIAAGLVLFSASAAAAANGGVPLPRPVRVVAYTVGLPVDSPALDDTNQHIKQLNQAVKAKDVPKAQATVRRLENDLTKVPKDEKPVAVPKVQQAIAQAQSQIPVIEAAPTTTTTAPPPATTTTTVTTSAPSTTVTTAEEKKEKDKVREKDPVTTTTEAPTTTTTVESTTDTTAPETDGTPADGGAPAGDPGQTGGDPNGGTGGDPAATTTTTTAPETTTTTAPETTTTSSTTTTTVPPSDAGIQGSQP